MKKTISLILALLMVISVFASCGKANDNTSDAGDDTKKEADPNDPFSSVDFGGRDFRISTSTNKATFMMKSSNYMIEGPEDKEGEADAANAVERNNYVSQLLNVNLVFNQTDLRYDEVTNYFRQYVQAGLDEQDLIINDMYGMATLTVENAFHNAYDCKNFDFTQNYWYEDYMEDVSFNSNFRYMLAGDYFIDIVRTASVLIFNKTLYESYFGDGEAFYRDVLDGKWTYDRFLKLCEDVYADTNNSGTNDEGDMYGFTGDSRWGDMISFIISGDPGFIERDEAGYPVITVYNERSLKLADYLAEIFNGRYTYLGFEELTAEGAATEAMLTNFTNGRSIFIGGQSLGSLENSELRNYSDNIGVVPLPKMDESDRYVTAVHDTTEVGFIPITSSVNNLDFISAVAEVLCRETGKNVMPAYYESALKIKYTRDKTSAEMVDLIHDNIGNTFALAWSQALGQVFMQATFYPAATGGDFTSSYKSIQRLVNRQLQATIETFEERKAEEQ